MANFNHKNLYLSENWYYNMDGFNEHDLNTYPCKKPRISYQDKVTNTARNRLSGALQVVLDF